jgi:exonuclease 3'-5' domain-containing protein 1
MFVDSPSSIQQFLREVLDQVDHPDPKRLYIDFDGVNLCRHGTVSILTLLVGDSQIHPDRVYLVDVHTLGSAAFTTPVTNSTSEPSESKTLKDILESPTISKVFFDVRNDSDALYGLYGIKMQGVTDLQLMENASRSGRRTFLHGLAKCIKHDSRLSGQKRREWEDTKEKGRRLFAPEQGGRYEVFNERPLTEDMRKYCEQDVLCMPGLYKIYSSGLGASFQLKGDWYSKIMAETESRIEWSTRKNYVSHGSSKTIAPPWQGMVAQEMEARCMEAMEKMRLEDNVTATVDIVVGGRTT